jgi:hypothetical protein
VKLNQLVLVHWDDSVTPEYQQWMELDEVDCDVHGCVSVGWVYRSDRRKVTLVQTCDTDTNSINGVISIPRKAITSHEVLIP